MAISKNLSTIAPLDYDIFFGLDVDKKSIAITVVEHKQKLGC